MTWSPAGHLSFLVGPVTEGGWGDWGSSAPSMCVPWENQEPLQLLRWWDSQCCGYDAGDTCWTLSKVHIPIDQTPQLSPLLSITTHIYYCMPWPGHCSPHPQDPEGTPPSLVIHVDTTSHSAVQTVDQEWHFEDLHLTGSVLLYLYLRDTDVHWRNSASIPIGASGPIPIP